jgi:hypothetical protein
MKKWLLLLTLTALFALVGCGNFNFGNPIGAPTVTLALGDSSLVKDTETGNWTLQFTVNAYTLPGSPAGVVNSFQLQDGGSLTAGLRVEACPATSDNDCGPFTKKYEIQFASYPPAGSYVITKYTVTGQNASMQTVSLADPLKVH